MFRRKTLILSDVLKHYLREEGLETPLLQHRLIEAWEEVAGKTVDRKIHTEPDVVCEDFQSGTSAGPFHDAFTARLPSE